ncbi:hypothetical protein [Epibacterium ulvae]|uniref:hypothetical protein n=1 Tax=Epibacterium ulvae TaxID=1156985 RepID=UPI001BFC47C5|nr:hypothetical protein [Epibacterium ulvae]
MGVISFTNGQPPDGDSRYALAALIAVAQSDQQGKIVTFRPMDVASTLFQKKNPI